MNDSNEWSYGDAGMGGNVASGGGGGLSFLPSTSSSSNLSSDTAGQLGIDQTRQTGQAGAAGGGSSGMDWLTNAGGGVLNWIGKNPGTAGLLGLAGYNATKTPTLPPALQQMQSNLGPASSYANNILGSEGQLNATQKAGIDASINQQMSDTKSSLMQNASSSGMGPHSLVTQQQLQKMNQSMEGQRQQLYMQAQQQNISQALSALGISNQGLSAIAQAQLSQDQNAQQLAAQFSNTASKMYALTQPGQQGQTTGGGGGGGVNASGVASALGTGQKLYSALSGGTEAGAAAGNLGYQGMTAEGTNALANAEWGAEATGATEAGTATAAGTAEAGTAGAAGASNAGTASAGAAAWPAGIAALAMYMSQAQDARDTQGGIEGANRTAQRLQQAGVTPDASQLFNINNPYQSLSQGDVQSMINSGVNINDPNSQYRPQIGLNQAYANQMLAQNPALGQAGVGLHDLGGDYMNYIGNTQMQQQMKQAQDAYTQWQRQYMYAPNSNAMSATQGGG